MKVLDSILVGSVISVVTKDLDGFVDTIFQSLTVTKKHPQSFKHTFVIFLMQTVKEHPCDLPSQVLFELFDKREELFTENRDLLVEREFHEFGEGKRFFLRGVSRLLGGVVLGDRRCRRRSRLSLLRWKATWRVATRGWSSRVVEAHLASSSSSTLRWVVVEVLLLLLLLLLLGVLSTWGSPLWADRHPDEASVDWEVTWVIGVASSLLLVNHLWGRIKKRLRDLVLLEINWRDLWPVATGWRARIDWCATILRSG